MIYQLLKNLLQHTTHKGVQKKSGGGDGGWERGVGGLHMFPEFESNAN